MKGAKMYKLKTGWTQKLFTPFTADLFLLPDNNKGLTNRYCQNWCLKLKTKKTKGNDSNFWSLYKNTSASLVSWFTQGNKKL